MDSDQDFIILGQVLPPPGAEGHPVNRILCIQSLSCEYHFLILLLDHAAVFLA